MDLAVMQWGEKVALEAFREKATANGMRVLFDMLAALVGEDAAMDCFERAQHAHEKFEEAAERGAAIIEKRKGVRFE
jgi:hypothetical protein